MLEADQLTYRYPGRSNLVLDGASLRIAAGDRVLVEGASGGGKSTLAALLTGLKEPVAGTLRLRDVAQSSIGLQRWRRAVAGAPQFHDNHVLSADLIFNLLMGRRWPPRAEDMADAERVCRELGLGPLLARMPGGLSQLVGEQGGSCRTVSAAACSSRGPCCKRWTRVSSMKVSPPSIRRPWTKSCRRCWRTRKPWW